MNTTTSNDPRMAFAPTNDNPIVIERRAMFAQQLNEFVDERIEATRDSMTTEQHAEGVRKMESIRRVALADIESMTPYEVMADTNGRAIAFAVVRSKRY